MTFPEFVQEVAVGLAVVVVVFCATCVVVIMLAYLDELAGWVSRQRAFRALQCRARGHGWITITFGYFGDPEPFRHERTCGHCHRTEVLPTSTNDA